MGTWEIALGPVLAVFLAAVGGLVLVVTVTDAAGFWIARISFGLAAVDILGFCIFLLARSVRVVGWQMGVGAGIAASIVALLILVLQWTNYREAMGSASLFPANDPMPRGARTTQLRPGDLVVSWGTNISQSTKMPHTVLMMGGDPMIVVDRRPKTGDLFVSQLKLFDDRDDIIAKVDKDGFWVAGSARRKRPDPSTLIVFDHNDEEVLRLRLLNRQALLLTGVFRHAGMQATATISADQAVIAGATLRGNFMRGVGTDVNVD